MIQHQRQLDLSTISDQRVVRAMESVERHLFVPGDLVGEAYHDRALPIGGGQTISQPAVVAVMTEAVCPRPTDRVLEIGAGSGYQAAILAELVDKVYTIEIDPHLATEARDRLRRLGYDKVELRTGDGHDGWIEEAPFDSILVTAAAEDVPHPLMDQLKDGGRMVIPVGTPFGPQELLLIKKHGRNITTRNLMPVRFVSFRRGLS